MCAFLQYYPDTIRNKMICLSVSQRARLLDLLSAICVCVFFFLYYFGMYLNWKGQDRKHDSLSLICGNIIVNYLEMYNNERLRNVSLHCFLYTSQSPL